MPQMPTDRSHSAKLQPKLPLCKMHLTSWPGRVQNKKRRRSNQGQNILRQLQKLQTPRVIQGVPQNHRAAQKASR